jgi:type I restriction enzyme R subunit
MTFIKTIISYLSKNGTIDKQILYKSPFTDLNDQGISGVFDNDADFIKVVKIIDMINNNAEVE